MSKNKTNFPAGATVRFYVSDGCQPSRSGNGGLFDLKSPLPLNIPAGATVPLKLGVRCNYPLLLMRSRPLSAKGLAVSCGAAAVDADEELEVTVTNNGREAYLAERGETLLRAAVLDNADLSVG